jgi:hypothetical protein
VTVHRRAVLQALLLLALAAPRGRAAGAPALRDLREGDFPRLVAAHRDRPLLVLLWSLTCAPCREELRLLGTLRRERGALPVVLVCTDGRDERGDAEAALAHAGLTGVESWIFAGGNANRLRYEIDPDWFGELRRAYFYDGAGGRTAVSGGLKRAQLEDWLNRGQTAISSTPHPGWTARRRDEIAV